MIQVVLDGGAVADMADLHRRLAELLAFPAWYGNNLDALFDALTDIKEETELMITDSETLLARLGSRGTALSRVLTRAENENKSLKITWEKEKA